MSEPFNSIFMENDENLIPTKIEKIDGRVEGAKKRTIANLEKFNALIKECVEKCTLKQSENKMVVASNREHYYMPFEEFKNNIREGKTIDYLHTITSKHLISFYLALIQNKINVSKEEFEKEYNEGKTIEEIAKTHNVYKGYVSSLREFYGIKRKGAKYI